MVGRSYAPNPSQSPDGVARCSHPRRHGAGAKAVQSPAGSTNALAISGMGGLGVAVAGSVAVGWSNPSPLMMKAAVAGGDATFELVLWVELELFPGRNC